MRMLPILVLIIIFLSLAVSYIVVVSEGRPVNPLKWAQDSRERDRIARARRISTLEHELGYRPCSDERCRECKMVAEGIPLPPPPTAPPGLTRLTKEVYDRQVEASRQSRFKRGTASGGPL